MITPDTAGLALAVAKGLVKFGGRLDRLLAEKVAVRSGLELTLPAIDFSPGPNVVLPRLQAYLTNSSVETPGPLGKTERASLAAFLPKNYAFKADHLGSLRRFFALAFPEEAVALAVSPDDTFIAYLRESIPSARACLPEKASDPDKAKQETLRAAWLASAFYVDPGADMRQLGYPVRVGLLVVDVLAEFGAENTQRFVRDESMRATVQAVLQHFAEPDLETFDAWSPLLRHTLSATLNGLLDGQAMHASANPWLGALFGALVEARSEAGADGDDYLLGLVQGRGYTAFIGAALPRCATLLDPEGAPVFQQVAADVLTAAAPLVQKNPESFGTFFADNWSAVLHAGLLSLEEHGAGLMEGKSPVLREVLNAVVASLAKTPDATLLTNDSVLALARAAVGAVATHPEIWQKKNGPPWLDEVIAATVKAINDPDVRSTFTPASLSALLQQTVTAIAAHPEWIVADSEVVQEILGTTLKALSGTGTKSANEIASALVTGALASVAARPELISTKYADVLGGVAALLATHLEDGTLNSLQASAIAAAAASAAQLHPKLFSDAKKNVAAAVTSAVLRAAGSDKAGLITGATTVALIQQLLPIFARNGSSMVTSSAIGSLEDQLTQVLSSGLDAASAQLGSQLDLPMVPTVLAALVTEWAKGNVSPKLKAAAFNTLFDQLVQRVALVSPLVLPVSV